MEIILSKPGGLELDCMIVRPIFAFIFLFLTPEAVAIVLK